jgi:hypothetical protein
MAATAVTLTAGAASDILAADEFRDFYTVQLQTDEGPVYLAFGATASAAAGLFLNKTGDTVEVSGPRARETCSAFSASDTPTLGIETMTRVVMRSQFTGPWPAA